MQGGHIFTNQISTPSLSSLAEQLASNRWLRHAVFLAAALVAIWSVGYHYGTFDQVIHLPYMKKFANPALYPGDPFLELRHLHFSFFWFLFIPFYRWGILEPVLFLTHVAVTYLTFWAVYRLSLTLFADPLAGFIGVLAFLFPHLSLAGFPILEYSLLNRGFVLPFLLWALIFYLRGRYEWSALLLGVLYNLHALSVHFFLAVLLVDGLLRWRTLPHRRVMVSGLLFLAAAAPLFIWRGLAGGGGSAGHGFAELFALRPDVRDAAVRGLQPTIYLLWAPYWPVLFSLLCGLGSLALWLYAVRRAPGLSPFQTVFRNFLLAIALALVVQVVTTLWLPVVVALQMQILRIGYFLLIWGILFFAGYLAWAIRQAEARQELPFREMVQLFALVASPLPGLPVLFHIIPAATTTWLRRGLTAVLGAMVGVILLLGLATQALAPGYWLYGPRSDWRNAQEWAKANTAVDATFIAPPHLFFYHTPDWRTFSERAAVSQISDLLEVSFAPEFYPVWQERFNAVAPGAEEQFNGDIYDNFAVTAAAYRSLTVGDIQAMRDRYGADYFVAEKAGRADYPFALVYENAEFRIFRLD